MKKKNKNATIRKKKEFRYHKVKVKNKSGKEIDIKHPCYIFLQIGNIYINTFIIYKWIDFDRIAGES